MRSALLSFILFLLCCSIVSGQSLALEPKPSPGALKGSAATPGSASIEPKIGKAAALLLPPEKKNPVKLPLFASPPVIDGKLDDQVWSSAVVLKDFYQVQPGDNLIPQNRTEVMLGYDSRFIYVAFHCYDEPDKVRASVAKRDDIFNDDYVGILFDTFNDQRRAYEFDFNPLGVQADGIWTEGVSEDFSLDIVFDSKGMVTTDGYTVEAAIPFKSLRYLAGKDKLWGIHFWRNKTTEQFARHVDSP